MGSGKDRLIIALDVEDWEWAKRLVDVLSGAVGGFKVGIRLYYRVGPEALNYLRGKVPVVFADLKLHDIPTTVAGGVRALTSQGANIINVHAAGGKEMMLAAREAAAAEAFRLGLPRPKVVAVTVLTSLNVKALQEEVGIMESVTTRVLSWARLAQGCGLDGVVASPLEAAAVKKACGSDFTVITPGVRLRSQDTADQRRVTTPAEAVREGADYIVVGRPVIEAADPLRAAEEIVACLD